ncbi:MAG: hypothetical protein LBT83_03205 [Tannerella sp.]|jgi:hypothetical protein|nr:hypothetical protein [Tannerella sp.]
MKISTKKVHYFNPGHETAVWLGMTHYTPPAPVCKMMSDLALLPLWYGEEGDYVLADETTEASRFLSSLPFELSPPAMPVSPEKIAFLPADNIEAAPWGLSPQSVHLFMSLRKDHAALTVPPYNDIHRRLTGRLTAAECLSEIQYLLPDMPPLVRPRFCSNTDEIRQFIATCPPPYLLKMPYSCSGQGLHWIRNREPDATSLRWITGAMKKQGQVSIEQALDKVHDFAMEFESDGNGQLTYKGLSVFHTLPKGPFGSSLLGHPDMLEKQLLSCVSPQQLHDVRNAVTTVLTEMLAPVYRGYLGVDMLIYRRNGSFSIHPMIELNLRYTMGLVALQVSSRLIHPSVQGRLIVACDSSPGAALADHLHMEKRHPLQVVNQKIHAGYFSLCPVTTETQYRAYILIL